MCDYCRCSPCYSSCPNAASPIPVVECGLCKEDMYDNEECFVGWINGEKYVFHEDCVRDAMDKWGKGFDFEPYRDYVFEIAVPEE